MIISQEKRQTNIAEYILYMWQTEDLIRSFFFDINKISENIVEQYDVSIEEKAKIKQWYSDLIEMMEMEKLRKVGHVQMLTNIVNDMNILHVTLLNMPSEMEYQRTFATAQDHILELEKKMPGEKINKIQSSLNGLYGILILKIQQKELSKNTEAAVEKIAKLLSALSKKYIEWEQNPDDFM